MVIRLVSIHASNSQSLGRSSILRFRGGPFGLGGRSYLGEQLSPDGLDLDASSLDQGRELVGL